MLRNLTFSLAAAVALATGPALTKTAAQARSPGSSELAPYLQCVPYARQLSGIQIYGDAHTWWKQAAGKYARGNRPKVGAVLAFRPHRNMKLGHVAAVSRVIDSRTVLLSHSNWSPINGRRGQIEDNVKAIDVSRDNDWSKVRVWYHPIQALGKTPWPAHGFIYGDKASKGALGQGVRVAAAPAKPRATSPRFLSAFAGLSEPAAEPRAAQAAPSAMRRSASQRRAGVAPRVTKPRTAHHDRPARSAAPAGNGSTTQPQGKADPVGRAVALYD